MNEASFRALIREIIAKELAENSTSAATPGFMTPNAFKKTSDDECDEKLKEATSRYQVFKKDESATPIQKIGRTLQEMNKSLTEMERVVSMASRLKTETNTPQSSLWKKSLKHLVKIEGRILKLAHQLQELKK